MNTSTRPALRLNSSPFFRPDQPNSRTTCTSWPLISLLSSSGSDSSSSSRIGRQRVARKFQCSDRLLAGHGGEGLEEILKRLPRFQIVEQVLNRHARARKDGRSALDLRISVNHGASHCCNDTCP